MAKLSCPLCLNPHFNSLDALRTSLVTATTAEIQCPVCEELQRGLDKFTIHLFTHLGNIPQEPQALLAHEPEPMMIQVPLVPAAKSVPVASTEVAKISDDVQAVRHLEISNETAPTVASSEIPSAVVGIEQEITNVQNVFANEQRTIRCDICNFTFSDENILDMHQKLLHQTLEDKQTGLYSYHCHLCSKKFKMKGSLMVHLRVAHYGFGHNMKTEHDVIAGLNKIKKPETLKNYEQAKKWSCEVCQKLFTTKYFLKKHKRLHTGEMPYFCAQCNKYFTFQQTYRKHMLYHSSEKPHVCHVCGRAFKELSTLHNHERIHSGERPFACEYCGKCFRQRVSYLVHKRIHTGVMPYKCTACGKSYRYKVSQRSHKCMAVPPGDVVKTPEISTTSAVLSPAGPSASLLAVRDSLKDNLNINSNPNVNIVFNSDGQIIGQNFTFDGHNLITFCNTSGSHELLGDKFTDDGCKVVVGNENKEDKVVEEFHAIMDSSSVLLGTLGTIGNDVCNIVTTLATQASNMSICCDKTSSASAMKEVSSNEKLQTINEESLKQLLYGAVHE